MEQKPDITGYFLGETSRQQSDAIRQAISQDPELRAELDQLETLGLAMSSLSDEEPPRRIAFVSDKVISPPWWQRMFSGWPQAALASACALAVAILGHGWMTRPMPTAVTTNPSIVATATIESEQVKQLQARLASLESKQLELRGQQLAAPPSVVAVSTGTIRSLEQKIQRLEIRQKEDLDAMGQQVGLLRRDLGNTLRARNQEAKLERVVDVEGRLP